jgi:hypothetical protein
MIQQIVKDIFLGFCHIINAARIVTLVLFFRSYIDIEGAENGL